MLGLHFFSPVERMPLVEVIRTAETSDATLARALDFLKSIDKTPVVVRDGLGFFTSRIVTTYSSETMNLLAEGVAPQLIDNAAINAGFSLGPVSLCDLVTMPLLKDIFASMRGDGNRIADRGSVARETVGKLADAGRVGKVKGNGVYTYNGDARDPWDGLAACLGTKPSSLDEETVRERLLYVQSLEAIRSLEDGVVTRPIDGDLAVGARLGLSGASRRRVLLCRSGRRGRIRAPREGLCRAASADASNRPPCCSRWRKTIAGSTNCEQRRDALRVTAREKRR